MQASSPRRCPAMVTIRLPPRLVIERL